MDHRRFSEYSRVSSLSEQPERIYVQDGYELNSYPEYNVWDYQPKKSFFVSEDEILLNQAGTETKRGYSDPLSLTTLVRPFQAKISEATSYLTSHNPITAAGREELYREITRSGPKRINLDSKRSPQPEKSKSRFLQGWRMGVFLCFVAVTLCLVVELVMLALAMKLNKKGDKDGIGVLYIGSCSKIERITTIVAIPLNIIATVLVATSNYVMQCLSAPSRKDIDKAHASGSYLNIGISSVHNLIHNVSVKSILWLVLVTSTIPIHLFLNSAFFGSLQANNYGVMIAYEGWNDTGYFDHAYNNDIGWNGTNSTLTQDGKFAEHMANLSRPEIGGLERLTAAECFARYSKELQSNASNVILVIGSQSPNSSLGNGNNYDAGEYYYNYTLAPPFKDGRDQYSLTVDYPQYVDPWNTFDMRRGVGLSFNPASGNAVPLFDETYQWTSAVRLANASGGLYYVLQNYNVYYFQNWIPSIFSSFDYHYWTTIKDYRYDFNDPSILVAGQWNPTSWMCPLEDVLAGNLCTGTSKPVPSPWVITPENWEIDYCMSENTEEQCSLQYSFHILLIVIGCDIAKMIAMAATLWMVNDHPLTTLGDAVASFLDNPDPHTRGCCLLDQNQARGLSSWHVWRRVSSFIRRQQVYSQANLGVTRKLGRDAFVWRRKIGHWYSAPSKSRWIAFGILYAGLFSSSIVVLVLGIRDLAEMNIHNPFSQGFGSINPNAIFEYPSAFEVNSNNGTTSVVQTNKPSNLLADVVTVNTPQLLFSTLYFMYNGMFTTMVTASEWSRLTSVRKSLRVSEPRAGQRSTYWLQLPWRYSLPLLCVSSVLHWLVSRSLFIVRIAVFGWDGDEQPDRDISACGYSPLAILVVIAVVFLSLVVMVLMSFRKLTPGIPLCGSNSLAIAAACHQSADDDDYDVDLKAEFRPLHWGVTKPAGDGSPGHCCITSNPHVGQPVEGMEYR